MSFDAETFNNLKPSICEAIKESCLTEDLVVYKIADQILHIKTVGVEPGVEITRGLSLVIDTVIKSAVYSGCDLSVIIRGILIGSFRARSVVLEAHKTIRLLIQEIIQAVFNHKVDVKEALEGILTGIVAIAKEHELNIEEALAISVEEILLFSKTKDTKFAETIKATIPQRYGEYNLYRKQ